MEIKKYKIYFREAGKKHIGETAYSGPLSKEGVIDFFGLDGDDVEWYEVEEIS